MTEEQRILQDVLQELLTCIELKKSNYITFPTPYHNKTLKKL